MSQINMCRFYGEHLSLVRYKDKARGRRVSIHSMIMKALTEGRLASSYKLVNMAKFNALPDDKHNLH